jgi:transcriptional regulator with XRE-family HTH domain
MTPSNMQETDRRQRNELTAGIVRAGRKLRGLTQGELSQYLGPSQSWVSKIETGQLSPSAEEWFEMCRLFRIDAEASFRAGFIDNGISTTLGSPYPESHFKVPKHYRKNAASKVRALRPFLQYFSAKLGSNKLTAYMEHEKIDPDFFLVLDNQISINFLLKMASELNNQGLLSGSGLAHLTGYARKPDTHGKLRSYYDIAHNSQELLRDLIGNTRLYEANFAYTIDDERNNRLDISVTPHDHIDVNELQQQGLADLLCRYKQAYFEQFASYGSVTGQIQISERECMFRGGKRCVYEVRIAA